jgi:hypothetical protein
MLTGISPRKGWMRRAAMKAVPDAKSNAHCPAMQFKRCGTFLKARGGGAAKFAWILALNVDSRRVAAADS